MVDIVKWHITADQGSQLVEQRGGSAVGTEWRTSTCHTIIFFGGILIQGNLFYNRK